VIPQVEDGVLTALGCTPRVRQKDLAGDELGHHADWLAEE
jgi:hypothetical protein